jgi:hypothetical protein
MRWFRVNRKFGGRLALFGLALQLVLSFGHIHPEDIYGNARAFAAYAASVASAASGDSLPLPAKHADDYCAICATTHLLGSSVVSEAPQLPLPIAFAAIEHADCAACVLVTPRRAPFQSRAPPAA